jgi:signal transduction histidine kinase
VDEVRLELTDLIHELRPAALQDQGLAAALRVYAGDWSQRNGIAAGVQIQGDRALPLETEQALFRIAQEALANVVRHSQAQRVEISLAHDTGSTRLTISDDGHGFEPGDQHQGLGLRSMQERAELLAGELRIESASGEGTRVSVTCPG